MNQGPSVPPTDLNFSQVIAAQNEEDADEGGESIETQSMNALAQLPHHQQVGSISLARLGRRR